MKVLDPACGSGIFSLAQFLFDQPSEREHEKNPGAAGRIEHFHAQLQWLCALDLSNEIIRNRLRSINRAFFGPLAFVVQKLLVNRREEFDWNKGEIECAEQCHLS